MRNFFNIILLLLLLTSCRWSFNENTSYRVTVRKEQIGNEYILDNNYFIVKSNYHENFILVNKLWSSDNNYRILFKGTKIKLIGKMSKWHIRHLFTEVKTYYYYRILTGRFKNKIIPSNYPSITFMKNLKLVKQIKHPKGIPLVYTKYRRNKKKKLANYSNLDHVNDPALPPFKDRLILKSSNFGF